MVIPKRGRKIISKRSWTVNRRWRSGLPLFSRLYCGDSNEATVGIPSVCRATAGNLIDVGRRKYRTSIPGRRDELKVVLSVMELLFFNPRAGLPVSTVCARRAPLWQTNAAALTRRRGS